MRTSELLSFMQDQRWTLSGTVADVRSEVRRSLLDIPPGTYSVGPPTATRTTKLEAVALGSVPVTNALFVALLDATGLENHVGGTYRWLNDVNVNLPVRRDGRRHKITAGYEDHPVVGVTWYGATMFAFLCGMRLPTEAEWEVAARSGDPANTYPWGPQPPTPELANYGQHVGRTTCVDAYAPNSWGFYDMAGNVREWCSDWLDPDDASVMKAVRGGAWNKGSHHLACHVRRGKFARMGSDSCGVRVALPA